MDAVIVPPTFGIFRILLPFLFSISRPTKQAWASQKAFLPEPVSVRPYLIAVRTKECTQFYISLSITTHQLLHVLGHTGLQSGSTKSYNTFANMKELLYLPYHHHHHHHVPEGLGMFPFIINQLFTSAQHLLLLIIGLHVSADHSVIFRSLICCKFQGAVHTFGIPIFFTLQLNPFIMRRGLKSIVDTWKLNPYICKNYAYVWV